MHNVFGILTQCATSTLSALRDTAILGIIFFVVAWFASPCNPQAPWWRKSGLMTDICFAIIPRTIVVYGQVVLIAAGMNIFFGNIGPADIEAFLSQGHGILSELPFWQKTILYLLGNDLIMYLTHRLFHTVRLWRFHAVHHSSESLDWISATRSHPVDQIFHSGLSDAIMILIGIPTEVIGYLIPWSIGSAALVHANVNWDFGKFRYLLASPIFHRWHHTSCELGGGSNFAGTFPIIDLVFGTFYMPRGERPSAFGLPDRSYPRTFLGQIAAPFFIARTRNGG